MMRSCPFLFIHPFSQYKLGFDYPVFHFYTTSILTAITSPQIFFSPFPAGLLPTTPFLLSLNLETAKGPLTLDSGPNLELCPISLPHTPFIDLPSLESFVLEHSSFSVYY